MNYRWAWASFIVVVLGILIESCKRRGRRRRRRVSRGRRLGGTWDGGVGERAVIISCTYAG